MYQKLKFLFRQLQIGVSNFQLNNTNINNNDSNNNNNINNNYPGIPPASILFARVTSLDQTSYCHFLSPRTPQSTRPECKPTLMFSSTSVASTTDLENNICYETLYFRKSLIFETIFILEYLLMEGVDCGR